MKLLNRILIFIVLLVITIASSSTVSADAIGTLTIHYLDVGQADCILIELPNDKTMMIDAGNNGDSKIILNYIDSLGIKKIDYLIGTHPHEDHIGSFDAVIDTFDINAIYMPYATTTTKTFEDVLLAIENKDLNINTAKADVTLFSDANLSAHFLAPVGETYDNLNNYSAVLMLTYGENSFLFMGDAEDLSENEILSKYEILQTDVLKVGHHGSSTSTSEAFLKTVNPSFVVISCGLNNSYGHPDPIILTRLYDNHIQIYRTDLLGTIVVRSNGKDLAFEISDPYSTVHAPDSTSFPTPITTMQPKPEPIPIPIVKEDPELVIIYVTKTGSKYHTNGCQYLNKSKIESTLKRVLSQGMEPCSKCNPPK